MSHDPRTPHATAPQSLTAATPNHLCHRAGSTSLQCTRRRPQVDPLTSTFGLQQALIQDLAGRAGIVGRQKHRHVAVVRRRAHQLVYAPWPYRGDHRGLLCPCPRGRNRPQAHASTAMVAHTRCGLSWMLGSAFRIFVFSFSGERLIYSLLYIYFMGHGSKLKTQKMYCR